MPSSGGRSEVADHGDGLLQAFAVAGSNVHAASVVDVDLDAGDFDDAANRLAARSDQVADLVGRNLQGVDLWCVLGLLFRSTALRCVHLVQQEQAAMASLFKGLTHDLAGDTADLDVHLQSSDALARSGYLEVHVAVVIFCACDVGQDGILFAFLHQAMATPATLPLSLMPASISASDAPQTLAIEDEPFDSRMSETIRNV